MNSPATNFNVRISSLSTEGQVLYASIDPIFDDLDGIGVLTYQWQRSNDVGGWDNISGATGTSYTLDDADVSRQVRLQVSHVDGLGATEAAFSSSTLSISNVNDAPSGVPKILKQVGLTTGGEFRVNTYTIDDQDTASVTALADGGWLVTWQSLGQDSSNYGILGQRYNSAGAPVGSQFQVNSYTADYQKNPSVTALADGGWIIVWESNGQDSSVTGIYGQRYDSLGAAAGSEFRINTTSTNNQSGPSVIALADGGLVVTWFGFGSDDDFGIYGQQYNASGNPVGNEFRVNTYIENRQLNPSVAALADGGWLVIWESDGQDGSAQGVYGQRYDNAGAPVEGEFRVNTQTLMSQENPSVTALADGGWLVTWQSDLSGYIEGQRYNSAGASVGSNFRVNSNAVHSAISPSIITLEDGGWLVTWSSHNDDGSGLSIRSQRYSITGTKVGGEFRVNDTTIGEQTNSSVTALADGGWLVSWQSDGQDGSGWSVYGKRYDANGYSSYTYTSTTASDFTENRTLYADATLISDADGLGAFGWQWQRSIDGGTTWTDISGATASGYTLGDADVSKLVRTKGTYTDSQGTTETVYSAASSAVINVNDAPVTFGVNIIGTAAEDAVLTATASVTSDPDGLPNPLTFIYQWQSSRDGSNWANIVDATSASFTPSDEQVGMQLRVVTTYTDGQGTMEAVTSVATPAVANLNDAPSGGLLMLAPGIVVSTPATEFRVNSFTAGHQWDPSVTALVDGGWIVTWASLGQDGMDAGIYGQRYNSKGAAVRVEFRINTTTAFSQSTPSATALADGGWLVTWAGNGPGDDAGIYGQRYSNTGTDVGAEFRVNTYNVSTQQSPSVTALSDGGWLVAWQSDGQDGSSQGIYGQRYSSVGVAVGAEFRVNTFVNDTQGFPAILALLDGGWLVTWSSNLQDGSNYGVYGQRYNSAGAAVGSEFRINTYTFRSQIGSAVTALADGGWVVTWSSDRQDGSNYGVYGQRYNSAGAAVGSEFRANTYTFSYQEAPSVAALADGGWLITWQSDSGSSGSGIYGQRYSINGEKVAGEFRVNTYTSGVTLYSSVTALPDGGWLVSWQSDGQDGSGYGIYGQRYDDQGSKTNTYMLPKTVASASDFTEDKILYADASLITDADGVGAVIWQWQRSGDGGTTWTDISGATSGSYTLGDADVSKLVRTKGTYTDGQGTVETVYSAASSAVINVNDPITGGGLWVLDPAPVVGGWSQTPVSDNLAEDQTLRIGGPLFFDADGVDSVNRQWIRSFDGGQTWLDILGATGETYTLTDSDVGARIGLRTFYVDRNGSEQIIIAGAVSSTTGQALASPVVTGINDAPSGFTVSINGSRIEDQVLTANVGTISDADGVGMLTYQWQRSNDGGGWDNVSSATGASYTLGDTDVSRQIRLQVRYVDGQGTTETAFSGATLPIASVNDAPTGTSQILNEFGKVLGDTSAEFRINTFTTNDQFSPAATALADGGWVVMWTSNSQDGSGWGGVFGQRYSSSGAAVGNEFLVNTYTWGEQTYPAVTALADGGWLVIWMSGQEGSGSSYGIYGQRYSSIGVKAGSEFHVNTYTLNDQTYPAVTVLADGGWVVVWQSFGQDGFDYGIYGQRYSSVGAAVGSEFQINSYTNYSQSDPSVAALADGGWIVFWESTNGIYGQRFNANGNTVGAEFKANEDAPLGSAYDYWNPTVSSLADGGWIALWQTYKDDGSSWGVYGQRYSSSGAKVGGEFRANTYNLREQTTPAVTLLIDGGWLVTWQSNAQDGAGGGIYGQRFSSSGAAVGSEFLVNTYTTNNQINSSVAGLADGGWIVTWESYLQDGSSSGIFSKRFYTINENKLLYADASLVADADGVGIVSWQWQRSGDGGVSWGDISGATSSSYTLGDSDAGKLVRTKGTYTDGQGTVETVYSAASTQVINVNDAPVGLGVSISGATTEDEMLTATASVTSDADGLPNPLSFTYQWQSSTNGSTWSNITGATSANFTPGDAEVARQLRVVTTYTDSQGTVETAMSAATAPVANIDDRANIYYPGIIRGDLIFEGQTLNPAFTANDPDGNILSVTYQWQVSPNGSSGWLDIAGATLAGFVIPSDQSLVGLYLRTVITTTDALGGISIGTPDWGPINNVNDAPVGFGVSISGPATEEAMLTATASVISDADGLPNPLSFTYQWQSSSNGTTWSHIAGATSANFTPDDAEVARQLRVVTTYTDSQGTVESATSAATASVANIDDRANIYYPGIIRGDPIAEGQALNPAFTANDPDGNILSVTYQWQVSPNGSSGWLDIAGATLASFVIPSDQSLVGLYLRTVVTTTDVLGGISTGTPDWGRINNVNDAPVISAAIADQGSTEDTAWSYQVPAGTFSDVDGDTLTYTAKLANGDALPNWLSFNASTRTFSGTPPQDFAGTVSLTVTASDGSANVSDTFVLTVSSALDVINGTSGNDTLTGTSGSVSMFTGGGGNDALTGGSRADVAVYTGNRSDYTVTTVAGVTTVRDNRVGSPDGTDTLRGMNVLRFADIQLFQSTAANKMTLAGQAQTFNVANSELVQGTNAAEHFIVAPKTSALVFVGNNDIVDLSGSINSYSFAKTGTQLQISDGTYTTTLSVGGAFTLRTASGSTSVAIDFAAGGAIKLGGTQTVGSSTFDPLTAIINSNNMSALASSVLPPTVEVLRTSDKTPILSGSAILSSGQALEVTVGGATYTTANGVVVDANGSWSLTLPTDLAQGTYDVTARIVSAPVVAATAVAGTPGNDTLTGTSGSVSVFTGGGGNDALTGGSRADVAVYTGNRSDYTVTTVAGVTTVRDNRAVSPDGTDTLRGMNILRFADIQLFQSTAANKVTLAGQAQTFNVANSELVQGTNAAEHFIVAPKTSALVFVGNNDIVDLSGSINSYSFAKTGTQLQISDGTYTTTLSVGGTFTLRTASGSTSVAIDFAAGGAIKLGGTQTVGSSTFDPLAAIANSNNTSDNAAFPVNDTTSSELTILGFVISGNSTVSEGQSLTLTINAEGVANGTVVPYALSGTGVTSGDITGGLSGSLTINNGQGSITITTALDRLTEGSEQLLVTLGGTASGTPAFAINIADVGLTPVTLTNGQSVTATAGKVDTFIIDASQSIAATIVGFEAGDVLEFTNHTADLGVNFEQVSTSDGFTTITAGASVAITLTNLANDNFGDEISFETIYGANAIGYVI